MSPDIWVPLLIAGLGGLCALLWRTNGDLDWVPFVLGVGLILLALGLTFFNYGVEAGASKALDVFLRSHGASIQRSLDHVRSAKMPEAVLIATAALGLFLLGLPYLIKTARKSLR